MDVVDPALKRTFHKLDIPLEQPISLAVVAVAAVTYSVWVKRTFKEGLAENAIVLGSISPALRYIPDLVKKYQGSLVPYTDNLYQALKAAVLADGSVCYIPSGVRNPMELLT